MSSAIPFVCLFDECFEKFPKFSNFPLRGQPNILICLKVCTIHVYVLSIFEKHKPEVNAWTVQKCLEIQISSLYSKSRHIMHSHNQLETVLSNIMQRCRTHILIIHFAVFNFFFFKRNPQTYDRPYHLVLLTLSHEH